MGKLALIQGTKLDLSEVTILLNGGSPREIDVTMQMFAGFGARHVRRAQSADEIRNVLNAEPVDLLIIDAAGDLAAMLDAVRGLRRMSSDTRYAPVVLLAANVRAAMLTDARDAGISYIVSKPLTPGVLFERLVWLVREARHFIQTETYAGPDRRVRSLGPPAGMNGRRAGDLSAEVGETSAPNMSQADIDAMMIPVRKAV